MQWHWVTYSCFDEALFLLFQYKYWIIEHNGWNIIWPYPLSPFPPSSAVVHLVVFDPLPFPKSLWIQHVRLIYMSQFSNWGWAATSNESWSIRTRGDSASPRRCFSFASDTCFYALVWWKSRVSVPPIWVIQVYVMGVDTFIDWRQVISIDVTLLTSGLQGGRRQKHVLFMHLL